MFILPYDQTQYPKFTAYVRDSFPTLLDVPNIISGLRTWGYMTMDEIRAALNWESGDMYRGVHVAIREVVAHEFGAKKGDFENEIIRQNDTFNEVQVSPKAVRAFEEGKGIRITGYGRKVYAVGAEMLGQLVYMYAHNHLWRPGLNSDEKQKKLDDQSRARRQGFFNQVYGGVPR